MKTILVTGASGFLGSHLIKELLENTDYFIIAIYRNNIISIEKSFEDRIKSYSISDYLKMSVEGIDTVINCAFPRTNNLCELADSLTFTEQMIRKWKKEKVQSVINISSQGVYKRLGENELSSETSPISPIDAYSLAKYSTELFFQNSSLLNVTNVRLSSLNMPQRFLSFFVENIKNGKPIKLTSPNSQVSLLDVTDAAKAIKSLIMLPFEKRSEIYNLGIGRQYTILEYANIVKSIGEKHGYTPSIIIEDNEHVTNSGMDCSKIKQDCNWDVKISPEIMIEQLF